uniref:Envelope protein n=1 Tax=Chionoecetes opilio bacilliform virus TaxID=1825681 RepID=A0A1Q3DL81_9VIRU|nr:wsv209-like protein [Chionoecetes opilio bacilliform virus]GAV93135.1 envelope protein [Chionoecetes opilio bacilliform virus]
MAHGILRLLGQNGEISNPYDPLNMDISSALGMKDAAGSVVGKRTVASLLPDSVRNHYLTYDCHLRIKQCITGGDDYECVSCRSLGGGTCVKASAELTNSHGVTDGVCIPMDDQRFMLEGSRNINPYTTIEEAYLQQVEDGHAANIGESSSVVTGGGVGGVSYLTRKLGCIDSSIVRKDPALLNSNPNLEPVTACTEIIMCGGKGIGAPIHPITKATIFDVSDIDFDISSLASSLDCYCEPEYTPVSGNVTGTPSCQQNEGGLAKEGIGCPVVFYSGDEKGCLCDNSTQVRLSDIVAIEASDNTSDYDRSYIETAINLSRVLERYQDLHSYTTNDACLPKPGVDPRMAAMGYSYASSIFGNAPEITAFNGGHLMTGGLLRKSAMDGNGNWHSRIEDNEAGKIVLSESMGGVVPYAGTGSVAAHVWNGDALNDHGLVGLGGGNMKEHPNASMRVVPLPHTNIPGLGLDSMDHAVAIVASSGRVFPGGVHARVGHVITAAPSDKHTDLTYVLDSHAESYTHKKDSPLARLRETQDSGVCATAYVVPSVHRAVREHPDAHEDTTVANIIPLLHYRPLAKRVAHNPIEHIFRQSILTAVRHEQLNEIPIFTSGDAHRLAHTPTVGKDMEILKRVLIDYYFPGMNGDGRVISPNETRSVFNEQDNEELTDIGGLILQPVTVEGIGFSSTFAKFGEHILATNSPKIIDHYKLDIESHKHTVDENESRSIFAQPPTSWRIVSNESSFFSGRGLNNGVEGTGMRFAEKSIFPGVLKPDAFAGAVMTGDGVLMYGESAPILRPMDIPAGTLPENTWFERRSAAHTLCDPGDGTILKKLRNAYSRVTSGDIIPRLNSSLPLYTYNTYNPVKLHYEFHDGSSEFSVWLGLLSDPVFPAFSPFLTEVITAESETIGTYGTLHNVVPSKFHIGDDWWQGCRVTSNTGPYIIPPTMALLESEFRLRTLSSETFIRAELVPNRYRADWGLSPHTAGHYMQGIFSPPCVREETGQAYGYPCSAALNQYVTMLVPKTTGTNSHSNRSKANIRNFIETQMNILPENVGTITPGPGTTKNIFDKLGTLASEEICNCTSDIFCPNVNEGGKSLTAPIAALPSRGNRHSNFVLMSTVPKNDAYLTTALLRAQIGDFAVLDIIGRIRGNGGVANIKDVLEAGYGINTRAILSPNRWTAFRRNTAYTPYSTRQGQNLSSTLVPDLYENNIGFDRGTFYMGANGLAGVTEDAVLEEDRSDLPGLPPADAEILNIIKNASVHGSGARSRRILDFFESSLGAAPITFNVGTFCPHAEGAKDIVGVYATPVFTTVDSAPSAAVNEGKSIAPMMSSAYIEVPGNNKRKVDDNDDDVEIFRVDKFGKPLDQEPKKKQEQNNNIIDMVSLFEASKNTNRIMRRIHLMPINTTYHGGLESGQTAAEAMCTRGVELWYRDFVKPSMASPAARTSLEGIRLKAPEPFDELAIKGYKSTDTRAFRKYAHHHHFGYEGLMSRGFNSRGQDTPVSEGDLKNNFPFVCQSNRCPFPPLRDGTMQPLALVDMGVLTESVVGRTLIQE